MRVCAVMAGGRGSRMGGVVKPALRVCGKPLIEHTLSTLSGLCSLVVVALSPYTRAALRDYCRLASVECIETSGSGYVRDLSTVLRVVRVRPLLVAPADAVVDDEGLRGTVSRAASLEASLVTLVSGGEPTGFTIFRGDGGDWVNVELPCYRDIDEPGDLVEAEKLCASTEATRRETR